MCTQLFIYDLALVKSFRALNLVEGALYSGQGLFFIGLYQSATTELFLAFPQKWALTRNWQQFTIVVGVVDQQWKFATVVDNVICFK